MKAKLWLGLGLLAVIAVCAVLLGTKALTGMRGMDMTADGLYSLSAGTQKILAGLNRPVTLKLYYSREVAKEGPEGIRFWNNYFFYVRDVLQEYAARANGNLRLEVIDPKPYSDEEETAIQAGLQSYGMRGESFLFGLLAETELGKQSVIPFFEPRRQLFVEYDVSKLISDLTRRDKSEIGVISSLPVLGDDYPPQVMQMLMMQGRRVQPPWALFQELRQSYNVEKATVEKGRLTKKYDYLMVVHPKKLDTPTLFAIDQYVMEGGRLLVFVDSFSLLDRPAQQNMMQMPNPDDSRSELNALLEKWGVKQNPAEVVVAPEIAVSLQMQRNRPAEPFLPFLSLNGKCVNKQINATAGLKDVRMVFAGALETVKTQGVTTETLLATTPDGNVWQPQGMDLMNPPSAGRLLRSLDPQKTGKKNLAVLARGSFVTNFPQGIEIEESAAAPEKSASQGDKTPKAPAKKTKITGSDKAQAGAAVLVISDVDMLSDQVAYQESAFGMMRQGETSSLVLNVLEFLGGDDNLISIRTRGAYLRPLTVVRDIEKAAEQRTANEVENLNAVIAAKQQELQSIAGRGGKEDVKLLKKEIIEKRREIEAQIRKSTKQLRQLQQARRDSVKGLENQVALWNLLAAPCLVLLAGIAVLVWRRRTGK